MTKNVEESSSEIEDTMKQMEDLAVSRMNDAKTGMKKLVIQSLIALILTVGLYLFKGATWYFWVLFAITLFMIVALAFGFYFIRKTEKLMEKE